MANPAGINFVADPFEGASSSASGHNVFPLLPGEVDGATTLGHRLAGGAIASFLAIPGFQRILFFVRGRGAVRCESPPSAPAAAGAPSYPFDGLGVFVGPYGSRLTVCAEVGGATLLELQWRLRPEHAPEAAALAAAAAQLPFFRSYAAAPTYREAIKSARTTSRTLVPTGVVPRFAAGSVHTIGPDAVGAHAHPMLEQFFLGLPSLAEASGGGEGGGGGGKPPLRCECVVTADAASAPLALWTLLHIPLGSTHGVAVEEGAELHYIWIDCFRDMSGESWISTMHTDETDAERRAREAGAGGAKPP